MNFNLFDQWGIRFDYSYLFLALGAISILLLIFLIILTVQLSKMKENYKKFMMGKDAKTLEESIQKLFEENNYIKELSEENKRGIRKINKEIEYSFNKLGIIRYDAFQQSGGKLSFAIALLNDQNNGFIYNSVHSTEGCYNYVKEIQSGLCSIDLSSEEKDALSKAMKK